MERNSPTGTVTVQNTGDELNTVALQESEVSTCDRECASSPIFIVGVWRSGTTLLYSLLNQHPEIRLFYESDLPVLWPMFRFPWIRKKWFEKWEYWNAGVSRHDLDPLRLASRSSTLAAAMDLAGREHAGEKGKKIWGCKSPSYYDRMVFLAREFPKARFIVIWRDPEEICSSVIRAGATALWFARPGMTLKALLACKTLKRQCARLLSTGAHVHQIHYRDLVEDTSNTMRGICDFLQVPFTPAVTLLNKADRSAVFEGVHHSLAKGNQIVSRKKRDEPLPPALTKKIQRYEALWKAEDRDWLLCQHLPETVATKPGIWEQATDQLRFMVYRLWDIAPRILFSVLPLSVWQTYRRLKYKDAQWVHRQLTKKPTTLHGD